MGYIQIAMALTLHGYRLSKATHDIPALRKRLTVKPVIPPVFVPSNRVPKYPVYHESAEYFYVPKTFGVREFGEPSQTTRDVPQTDAKYWDFKGSLRPQQEDVVNAYLKPVPHDGILSLATGGGKTVCALYIASQLKLPTLIIVHNTFLYDQWCDRIRAFLPHCRIGKLQGETVDVDDRDVVIAMLQSLSMKTYPIDTFKRFGLVVVDECHHIASEVFIQAIPKITSKHMLGLSATPVRKDGLMFVMEWVLGPILYKSEAGDTEDSQIRVEVYEFKSNDSEYLEIVYNSQGVMSVANMVNKLTAYEPRTALIVEVISDIVRTSPERQILVLSDRVQHTKDILKGLPPDVQSKAAILSTDVKSAKRAEFCVNAKVLVATYAMCKEGFDVATLNTLVIATPRPDVDQIVGRILRVEKSARKVHPLIIDIMDSQFRRQFQERLSLYNKRKYTIEKMALE
jgi:superfamily II DNA or RNA helicase